MNQSRKPRADLVQPDLFMSAAEVESRPEGTLPDGFAFAADLVPEALARDLVARFGTLPFRNFDFHGFQGNRRIVSFGWRYEYSGRGELRESDPMPNFLDPLREIAADFAGLKSADFQQALITEYAPGAGIGWHRDKPMFEDVISFSFENPCRLRFRCRSDHTWKRAALTVTPRSAYLLRDEAREIWEHSVPTVDALRYSVTLRTFKPGQKPATSLAR
jgi:alkylated DNA repair dioxygenase AlkB